MTFLSFTMHLQKFIPKFSQHFFCETSFPKSTQKVPGKKDAGTYLEPIWKSAMDLFAETVNDF